LGLHSAYIEGYVGKHLGVYLPYEKPKGYLQGYIKSTYGVN
jgi:hypothetical protein